MVFLLLDVYILFISQQAISAFPELDIHMYKLYCMWLYSQEERWRGAFDTIYIACVL